MATNTWLAVSRFDLDASPRTNEPAEVELYWIHAKQVGSMVTACGLGALTWRKHWQPFHSVGLGHTCPTCTRTLAEERNRLRSAKQPTVHAAGDRRFVDL